MERIRENFRDESHADTALRGRRYEECVFEKCLFTNTRLTEVTFVNCTFHACTFHTVDLTNCTMMNSAFTESSLIGIDWSGLRRTGRLFGLFKSISRCHVRYNTFVEMKLAKTDLSASELFDCYFRKCDLSACDFRGADLEKTVFEECDLRRADFRDARRYSIDIHTNRIAKARFSTPEVVALLGNLDIRID